MEDIAFSITLDGFNEGNAPLSHVDSKTFIGNKGQSSDAKADLISTPGFLTASPALANLTNGTQAGVVGELLRFILDKPTAADTTFAVGATKLYKLSSTAVVSGGSPSWPQTVTNMTEGESVIRLKANLYVFYNKSSGGDIAQMPLATSVIDPDWGSSVDAAGLEKAPHPVAVKEDIMLFGNGRYVGVYIEGGGGTLDMQKLDFGEGSEVADVAFMSNVWWIAVNYGEGKRGEIYLYEGGALSSILSDEAGVGDQKIGFLYVQNGIMYVAYDDKTNTGYAIGWLQGRVIKPLRYFKGALPTHRQKTMYKNTILFCSDTDIWSMGAPVEQLPIQISKLCDGGYATLGGIASPFGTPMIASTDGGSNFRLAQFSGLSTDSFWKSIWIDLTNNVNLGHLMKVIVQTKQLEADARADLVIEGNQGKDTTAIPMLLTGADLTRFEFDSIDLPDLEDCRVYISYASGHATKNVPIRKIILLGNYVER